MYAVFFFFGVNESSTYKQKKNYMKKEFESTKSLDSVCTSKIISCAYKEEKYIACY